MAEKSSLPLYYFSPKLLDDIGVANFNHIVNYLERLKEEMEQVDGKTYRIIVALEEEYMDNFFLRDYSIYYADELARGQKLTTRMHFFLYEDLKALKEKLLSILEGKSQDIEDIKKHYLGFTIKKPVYTPDGKGLIGRSVLRPYPKQMNGERREYISTQNRCSLWGIELEIETLPFHPQDLAVGACASAALWTCQFLVNKWLSIPIRSLGEITQTSYLPPYWRATPLYPSKGLTVGELAKYISDVDSYFHPIELFEVYKRYMSQNPAIGRIIIKNYVTNIIRGYLSADFPIISGLRLYTSRHLFTIEVEAGEITEGYLSDYMRDLLSGSLKIPLSMDAMIWKEKEDKWKLVDFCDGEKEYILQIENGLLNIYKLYLKGRHAVVISGYKYAENEVNEIYLHDDTICPYSKTEIDSSSLTLKNEWITERNYDRVSLETLIIPTHPLVKLDMMSIFEEFLPYRDEILYEFPSTRLQPVKDYKAELLSKDVKEVVIDTNRKGKLEYLLSNSPKYLWVLHFQRETPKDIVIDSTSSIPKIVAEVYY